MSNKTRVRTAFNEIASIYDVLVGVGAERKVIPFILTCLPPRRVAALDIGCGAGRLLSHLAPRFTHVFGIDFSPNMVREARHFLRRYMNTQVLEMDAEHLTFREALFDFVVSVSVFHHLDAERALAEASRMVRPGGRLLVLVPLGTDRPVHSRRSVLHRVQNWGRLILQVGVRNALRWKRTRKLRVGDDRLPTLEEWKHYAASLPGSEISMFQRKVVVQWDRPRDSAKWHEVHPPQLGDVLARNNLSGDRVTKFKALDSFAQSRDEFDLWFTRSS